MAKTVVIARPPRILAATLVGAIAVGLFNVLAWRAAKAKKFYLDHCDVALDNPKLSNPALMKLDFAAQTADGSKELFERYEWYVARLVYTLDEALRLSPSEQWYATAETQLANHKAYFASPYYAKQDYLSHYSARMRSLIDEAREGFLG